MSNKSKIAEFEVRGLTSLKTCNWGARVERLAKPIICCYPSTPKNPKDMIFRDFLESLYIVDKKKLPKRKIGLDGQWPFVKGAFGVPSIMFKRSMISAASNVKGVSKLMARSLLVQGDLLPLHYSKLVCTASKVVIGGLGGRYRDIRIGNEFHDWSTRIKVKYLPHLIGLKQIQDLLVVAGQFEGIGVWRPQCNGDYGRFSVTLSREKAVKTA